MYDEQPLYAYGIRHNDLIYARIHENDQEPNFTEVATALITACAENANKRQQYTNTWREMDEVRGVFFFVRSGMLRKLVSNSTSEMNTCFRQSGEMT